MAFRKDLLLISSWIKSNTKVLDLGCGNGELLKILKKNQNVRGYGIDNDIKNIKDSLKKDVNVLQIDLDNGLSEFETNSFDYVVLAQSLQVVKRPKELIDEMLRIGKEIIVSFGPFALLEENSIVILLITEKTEQVMLNCFQEIAARGANIVIFTNSLKILVKLQNISGEKLDIIFIETLKYYSEINFVVALQYLTYDLSMKLEINPDKPRNLAKVVTVQ